MVLLFRKLNAVIHSRLCTGRGFLLIMNSSISVNNVSELFMSAGCIAPAEYICPVGFFCGWPVDVESAARLPERPGSQQRHFLQKTFLFAVYWYIQHARGFTTMRSINLFILLSYLVLELDIHKCTTVSLFVIIVFLVTYLMQCSRTVRSVYRIVIVHRVSSSSFFNKQLTNATRIQCWDRN